MQASILTSQLWTAAGMASGPLDRLQFSNTHVQLPSVFPVGAVAAATIGAQALMAAELWRQRGGQSQQVTIDQAHALAMFRSERYLTVDGKAPPDPWDALAGYYQAGDGRWIQLHTNFPHHHQGVVRVLQCADNREAVAAAIKTWRADQLDVRLAEEGLCAAMIRGPQEWRAHPQAAAIAALPLFDIERVADAPAEPLAMRGASTLDVQTDLRRPLDGVRVLDLSRIIAAPVAGRTLAQHGADVLAVSAAHLPNIPTLVIDNGRGKRAAQLDLRQRHDAERLRELVRGADIFLHAYRPGALAARGFSSAALQALRPGLVEVSLSAYSHKGPWAERRGFDSLVQSATGIAWEEGQAAGLDQPGKLPCQALDHATGYLAAFCAMAALRRRASEGGGWRVRVSLAQTGAWLQAMDRVPAGLSHPDLTPRQVEQWIELTPSAFGNVGAVAPAERMAETPAHFALPPAPLDAYEAAWL
jgi:crotonobetainyl-CoA:carnitine CoA-transferase CaiB-like acyl-CoA transferase